MTEKKEREKPDLGVIVSMVMLIFTGMFTILASPIAGPYGNMVLTVGLALMVLGMMLAVVMYYDLEKLRKLHEHRMKQANSGVVWVWAVCFLAIGLYSIAWFAMGWPALAVMDSLQAMYPGNVYLAGTVAFIRFIFQWHPILMIMGLLIWAYVNSQRVEDITYPR